MPLVIAGATSGSTTVQATDAVTATITLPSATTTLVGATTPSFTTTIGVGNATPSTSGAGITFPATQSASTNANTLDDYEEGTWTPVGTWTTQGTGSTVVSHANYTKIGRVVTITTYFSANRGTASGTFTATGLPFASVGAIAFMGGTIGVGATSKIPFLSIDNSGTIIKFNFLDQATTYGAAVTGASMAATDNYIQLAFSYTTT
jgi:hypothetical protein